MASASSSSSDVDDRIARAVADTALRDLLAKVAYDARRAAVNTPLRGTPEPPLALAERLGLADLVPVLSQCWRRRREHAG
jgi:hypothetical protein